MAGTDPVTLPGPLVTADWLAAHLDDVVVVDLRWYPDERSPATAYEAGHVPGAVRVDLDTELAGPPGVEGRHPLPSPTAFAEAMGRAGIGDATPVVVYDDARGSIAARLWWMLRVLDHPVAVLDGGLDAWWGPQVTGPPGTAVAAARFTERPWPAARFVTADEVDQLRTAADALVVDARAGDRFAGAPHPLDLRPGHIPGARNAPWAGNVDESGRFRDPGQLRDRFEELGAAAVDRVVASCGSGVTACHDLLALEVAGLAGDPGQDRTALFVGSWSAWAADPSRPVATGAG